MKLTKIVFALFLVGCVDNTPDSMLPDAEAPMTDAAEAADALTIDAAVDAPTDAPPMACPELSWGVIKCSDLAPECSGPLQPPEVEGGLHCIPGYEDNLRVPCFCVGINSTDAWCIREDAP